jgi:hypothetical protein
MTDGKQSIVAMSTIAHTFFGMWRICRQQRASVEEAGAGLWSEKLFLAWLKKWADATARSVEIDLGGPVDKQNAKHQKFRSTGKMGRLPSNQPSQNLVPFGSSWNGKEGRGRQRGGCRRIDQTRQEPRIRRKTDSCAREIGTRRNRRGDWVAA